jgi:hypothetical protein
MTSQIPAWLTRHLEATGKADTDHVKRRVQAGTCHGCQAPILTGLDAARAGYPSRVQPTPVSPLGEALAVAAGVPTYDLTDAGDRYELELRDPHTIPARRRWPVLAAHRCGVDWPTDPAPLIPVRHRSEPADVCPF